MITDGSTAQGKPCGVFYREGHLADSEKLDREVLEIWSKTLGPEHPNTLSLKANIADTLLKEGHFREAERLQRETLATQIRLRGPEDLPSLVSQSDLAETLIREGRYAEAEETARAAFQVQLRKLGPLHPDTVATMRNLGRALAYTNRYAEASRLFRDAIDKQEHSKGQGTPFSVWYSFATIAVAANRPHDALQYLQEAIHRGYKDADGLIADDDLKSLRHNAEFLQLVAELKGSSTRNKAP